MIEVTRGALVEFYDCQFRDKDKNPTVPESALLRISYLKRGCKACDEIEMIGSNGLWSATWDSSEADPGNIYWFIESTSPEAKVGQGQFRLVANPAAMGCGC
ncbi:hypothetical protein W911_14290 [Hyphomicrobium nitrativorans NL23]|uniref:Uncharacterized protein n=1 Tax=Hyphomicrobium nitrativorans NL23 TaxID=1029756 RepID=V5SJR6_9HYPH|nr:hypothetical protein [Hyphomicrobium nitrativorans]AHB50315.1 hypothetical protein W911_14290 [Hyphomicrobium nitrativorans NL23]